MQKWCFLPSAAAAAVLLALGKPLLWMFGPEFTAAYPLMFILAIGLLMRAFAGPAQNLLVMAGHQDRVALILAITIIICLGARPRPHPGAWNHRRRDRHGGGLRFEAAASLLVARAYFRAA